MPLMILAATLCPKSVETTFYALVLAMIDLGYLVSYWIGGLLTIWLGIGSNNFQHFWILILISCAWPLISLLFLILLPKDIYLSNENQVIIS